MAEYIERQKVFASLPIVTDDKKISLYGAVADFMVMVSAIPSADVAPVRHGKWLFVDNDGYWYNECSVCGGRTENHNGSPPDFNYCPICGARMDGGDDNEKMR